MLKKLFCITLLMNVLCCSLCVAIDGEKHDLLDLKQVELHQALHVLAVMMHKNVIINPEVHGEVTLHLQQMALPAIWAMLLQSHDLVEIPFGQSSVIVSRNSWMQHVQNTLKLQNELENIAPLKTSAWQIRYAKAEDISRLITDSSGSLLSKRGHVRVDERTNTVFVHDMQEHIVQIHSLIQRVDVPVQQLLIETHLASVDSDFEQNLGIHFAVTDDVSSSALAKTRYSLLVAKLADGSILDMQLSALENSGHGELISSPRLFTANQQAAMIEAGEEIPYQEESPSGGTTIKFKKAVLSLKVTPQLLPGKKILLQLQINQDKPSKRLVQGTPTINTREISTHVLVKDGQTIVLGGIYESENEHAKESIPFLSDIPILGLLFQQHDTIKKKRELLIFVTPRVIPL